MRKTAIWRRLEDNEVGIVSHFTRILKIKETENYILVTLENFPIPFFNRALRINTNKEKVPKVINEVIKHFSSHGMPACFTITPFTEPEDFSEHLIRRGFKLIQQQLIMAYKGGKNMRLNPEVEVKRAKKSEVATWINIVRKGFNYPEDFAFKTTSIIIEKEEFMPYLAHISNKPVGCGMLYSENGVSGIYAMVTLPEYRRKGVASAVLHEMVLEYERSGDNLLTLGTEMGSPAERLYKKVGFQTEYIQSLFLERKN